MFKNNENYGVDMQIITINIPTKLLERMNKLREEGLSPSRSEFIRQCINFSLPYWEDILAWCNEKPMVQWHKKRRSLGRKNDDDLPFNYKVVKVLDKNPNGHLDKITKDVKY